MKWPLFENKIRRDLINHDSEIDIQDLWSGMESEVNALNRKKKKRRALIWFFFLGLVGLTGLISLNINSLNQKEVANSEIISENIFTPNSEISTEKKTDFETENVHLKKEISENEETDPGLDSGVAKSSPTHDFNRGTTVKTTPKLQNPKPKTAFESAFAHDSEIKEVNQTDIRMNKEIGFLKGIRSLKDSDSTNLENDFSEKINSNKSDLDKKISPTENSEIEQKTLEITEKPIAETTESEEKIETPKPEINRKKPFKFAVSAQGGLAFTDRTLESKQPEYDKIRGLRDQTERSLETAQFGLQIHLQHKSGLELTSGINHTQINERFRYTETVTTQDSVWGIQFFVIDLNDNVDTIWGNVPLDITGTFNKRYYNRFKMIEVPILLGWSKDFGKVRVGAQAGVFANISMKTEGHVLTNASEDIDVNESEIYRTNVGLSYYFGISAGYDLNDNLEIFASPFARIFAKNFEADNYGLSQKYRIYGMNVGARYSF